MNSQELILAIITGNEAKIKEFKDQPDREKVGCYLEADLNKNGTWHIKHLGMQKINDQWVESDQYAGVSAEDLAAIIVKYDCPAMAAGFVVNGKSLDRITDPGITDEAKYLEAVEYLKQIPGKVAEMVAKYKVAEESKRRYTE